MILNDEQRRVLTYVREANRGAYQPTVSEVTEWHLNPDPKPGKRGRLIRPGTPSPLSRSLSEALFPDGVVGPGLQSLLKTMTAIYGSPPEYEPDGPPEGYLASLIRLGWLASTPTSRDRLTITDLGRALLRAAEMEEAPPGDVLVLAKGDDLSYPMLIGRIAELHLPMVVDPYLKPDQMLDLLGKTTTSRFLVGPNLKAGDLAPMKMLCEARTGTPVELRQADKGDLHDRYIVSSEMVYSIGTSMNGIQKSGTLLFPLTDTAATHVRQELNTVWESAKLLAHSRAAADESDGGLPVSKRTSAARPTKKPVAASARGKPSTKKATKPSRS